MVVTLDFVQGLMCLGSLLEHRGIALPDVVHVPAPDLRRFLCHELASRCPLLGILAGITCRDRMPVLAQFYPKAAKACYSDLHNSVTAAKGSTPEGGERCQYPCPAICITSTLPIRPESGFRQLCFPRATTVPIWRVPALGRTETVCPTFRERPPSR